jgi:hypothetical protein
MFKRILPWQEGEPVGAATFFGATVGVLLGSGLAGFGIVLQMITQRNTRKRFLEDLANQRQRLSRERAFADRKSTALDTKK